MLKINPERQYIEEMQNPQYPKLPVQLYELLVLLCQDLDDTSQVKEKNVVLSRIISYVNSPH